MDDNLKQIVDGLTKKLVDEGKLIEAGWVGYKMMVLPKEASEVQISEMRTSFFAGCQHLFGSIFSFLEPGSEPTDKDLDRMTQIDSELKLFLKDFKERNFI